MALNTTTNINVDFYDKKYILINAKQYDKKSRFLLVNCYNQGEPFPINSGEHVAYIKYRKPDNHSVFNFCEINRKGQILVELTEQMLISSGICYVELVIANKGDADVDTETGEIVAIENASILSTMVFCIDVSESAVENTEIESSYEYNALNTALEKVEAGYKEVILTAKSYAVGNAEGIRENEDYDNAKYYYEQSLINANNASNSEDAARTSETNARTYMNNAETYMNNASISEGNAQTYMNNAKSYMDNTQSYMNNTSGYMTSTSEYMGTTKAYMDNTKTHMDNAKLSETNAKVSETNASASEQNAKLSEDNALNSANLSKSYAVGSTGIRNGEDEDNAQYYYELTKNIVIGLDSGFIPMGTISFSELALAEKATGYVYNISDDFVTTSDFAEGYGKSYTAGTNVYYTAKGYWDCFGGSASVTASVDEVKTYLGI